MMMMMVMSLSYLYHNYINCYSSLSLVDTISFQDTAAGPFFHGRLAFQNRAAEPVTAALSRPPMRFWTFLNTRPLYTKLAPMPPRAKDRSPDLKHQTVEDVFFGHCFEPLAPVPNQRGSFPNSRHLHLEG